MSSELKPLLTLLLFAVSYFYCSAQGQSFDAVEKSLLEQLSQAETIQDSIDIYNKLSFNYRRISPQSMMDYADVAIQTGQSANYIKGIAIGYKHKGIACVKLDEKQDSAIFFFEQAISYAESIKDYYTVAACTNNIGRIQIKNLERDQAIQNFFKTITLIDSLKIEDAQFMKAIALGNLGEAFKNKKEYDKAIEYLEQAMTTSKARNAKVIASIYLDELAISYLNIGLEDKAIELIEEALKVQNELNDYESQVEVLLNYADIELAKKQPKESLRRAQQAYQISLQHQLKSMYNRTLLSIAKSYFAIGNLKEAKKHAATVYEDLIVDKSSSNIEKLHTLQLLSEITFASREYKEAYQYLKLNRNLQQILNDERAAILSKEAAAKYNNDITLAEVERLEKDQLSQRKWINTLLGFLVLIVLLFFIVFSLYRKKTNLANELNQRNKEMTIQSEELQRLSELKDKLFSTISHDLKSPIANFEQGIHHLLSGELLKEDFFYYAKTLKADATQLRKSVDELMNWSYMQMIGLQPKVTDVDLHKMVEENINIYRKIAEDKKIVFYNKLAPNCFVKADQEHLNSIVRNLTSNAVKFSNEGGIIIFRAHQGEDIVTFSVEDQGIGIEKEQLKDIFHPGSTTWGTAGEKGTGLGLALCKEFVEQNGGKIWVKSDIDNGSIFFVTFPKHTLSDKTQSPALSNAVL
ncbi:MAG: ATP-binding protein [Bacteroidota bacterium]